MRVEGRCAPGVGSQVVPEGPTELHGKRRFTGAHRVQQPNEGQIGPTDRAVDVQQGLHAGGMVVAQGLAAIGQRVPAGLVEVEHSCGDEMSQQAIERVGVDVRHLSQRRSRTKALRDVVGHPQRRRHSHCHRRHQVRQSPDPVVRAVPIRHHVSFPRAAKTSPDHAGGTSQLVEYHR